MLQKTNSKSRVKKRAKKTAPKSTKPSKPFLFLSLPPELRDYICELALTEPDGLTLVAKTKSYRRTIGRGLVYDDNGQYYRRRRGNAIEGDNVQRE